MSRSPTAALIALLSLGVAVGLTPTLQAHDFEETRRLVLDVRSDRLELLVAYEVRPGARAAAIRARFDQDHDGRVTSDLERLARARVVVPRLTQGIALEVRGHRVPLALERLEHPRPPHEGGRVGVAALALFSAPLRLPDDGPLELAVVAGEPRGAVRLEVQAEPGVSLASEGMTRRPNDPVLGPATLASGRRITLSATRR